MQTRKTLRTRSVAMLRTLGINRHAAKLYYNYVHGFASAGRELPAVVARSIEWAVAQNPTDTFEYHEFGVFKGHTLLKAFETLQQLKSPEFKCVGYDSFCGLPAPEGIDLPSADNSPFYQGQYACPKTRVERELTKAGINWDNVTLVPGFFSESLTTDLASSLKLKSANVVLVDCDLYASSVDVFEFIEGLIGENTVLILDDYESFGTSNELGQKRAFAEFCERLDSQFEFTPWFDYGSYGQVFRSKVRRN